MDTRCQVCVFHGVLARAHKLLDVQVLLDPLEEQLDPAMTFLQGGNGQRRQAVAVAQEDQRLAGLGIFEADVAQMLGIVLGDIQTLERNALIADYSQSAIGHCRIHPLRNHGLVGARADLDIAQEFSLGQLRKGHYAKQVGTIQSAHIGIAAMTINDSTERFAWYVLHDLCKKCLAKVHSLPIRFVANHAIG